MKLKPKWMLLSSIFVVVLIIILVMTSGTDQTKKYPVTNKIQDEVGGEFLQTTLALQNVEGGTIAVQNGIPVPSFDRQERLSYSLNGTWKKKRFEADHDFSMRPRDAKWLAEVEENLPENMSDWEEMSLPLPENEIQGLETANSMETYEDGVWYSRTFKLDKDWDNKAITLKFLSVNYVADVWVNGEWVGYHEGGYTPFAFDITPFVTIDKTNDILIRVDNPPWGSREDIIPAQAGTDWFNYTGIIQDVFLEATEMSHIVRADLIPKEVDGSVEAKVVIENRSLNHDTVTLSGEIFEADRKSASYLSSPLATSIKGNKVDVLGIDDVEIELQPREIKVVTYDLKIIDPMLWSPDEPNLYVAELKLKGEKTEVKDSFSTQFGLRTVTTESSKILLNDQPVFLAGIGRHEEWPNYGRTSSWERIKDDLQQMANSNVNMVRTAHYPNHIDTYILLDRLGLMAMSEIPLWQFETTHYQIQEEKRLSDQMWREMIFSQFNRPSVILWSTQNESKDVLLRKEYNERVVKDLKENYNDGRLTTQSAAADHPGFNDISMEPLDVAGWTMYFGVFHGGTPYEGTRLFLRGAHEAWPNKPVLNTEFGHWSREDNAEADKQVEIYTHTLDALTEKSTVSPDGTVNENGYVAGIDFWLMYNWYVNHNQWIDTFGITHMDRKQDKPVASLIEEDYKRIMGDTKGIAKKEASLSRKTLYNEEEMITFNESSNEHEVEFPNNTDISKYHYMQIVLEDEDATDAFKIIIEDAQEKQFTYETYDILRRESHAIRIPLHQVKGIDLTDVTRIQIISQKERKINLKEIYVSVAGTD